MLVSKAPRTHRSRAKSKQLAFCSAGQSFCSHSCDVVHARVETADGDCHNDAYKWNCNTALPSSSQTKPCNSLISQHKENMGKIRAYLELQGGKFHWRGFQVWLYTLKWAIIPVWLITADWGFLFCRCLIVFHCSAFGGFYDLSKTEMLRMSVWRCGLHHVWKKGDLCEQRLMSEEMCKRKRQRKE